MADIQARAYETEPENEIPSFADIAVLPAQFYGARRVTIAIEPLRRLMFALLIDGIRCFQTSLGAHSSAKRQQFADAQSWIFSKA